MGGGRKETITDDIVRDFFKQYENDIIIERQSSQNPSIDKLLKNASKKGEHNGYPDIIIQYKQDANFIIVIEDKSDKRYHESDDHKQYEKYAVDGVLLYASFLSKQFDVLAIAVSGTDANDLKISHYIHLKASRMPLRILAAIYCPQKIITMAFIPVRRKNGRTTTNCWTIPECSTRDFTR